MIKDVVPGKDQFTILIKVSDELASPGLIGCSFPKRRYSYAEVNHFSCIVVDLPGHVIKSH